LLSQLQFIGPDIRSGAVIAMQTFGDFLGFNPHTHILATDGCFYGNKGMFRVAPPLELKKLEAIFQLKYACQEHIEMSGFVAHELSALSVPLE